MSAPDARGVAGHWDSVYGTKNVDEVSWYQPDAGPSTHHVLAAAPASASRVAVDVGAGTSTLVDELLDEGWRVTLLDVSAEALAVTQARLGERADAVRFVVTLGEVFAGPFEVESSGTEVHRTPWGAAQQFTRVTLRRC